MKCYATIVADPPWKYGKFNGFSNFGSVPVKGREMPSTVGLPYPTMTVDEICALPVSDLADDQAHLYLWTTQKYLWEAPRVVEAWGFTPSCVLTWCKPPQGTGMGFAFAPTTEFVLFAHRGGLAPLDRHNSTWFQASRNHSGKARHSGKPEMFLDLVERVSPGPYLELFARRNRLGWATWGNEALEHEEIA